jgi:hypothetical protein
MDPLGSNPLAVLTFIVAPAVLTNASSVMSLQTANRFARTIDRARSLASQIEGNQNADDVETRLRLRQLDFAERRAMLLLRALTAFNLSVGSFAGASFTSLLVAIFAVSHLSLLTIIFLTVALCCGIAGVGGLVTGSGLLVWETRQALAILIDETQIVRQSRARRLATAEKPRMPESENLTGS